MATRTIEVTEATLRDAAGRVQGRYPVPPDNRFEGVFRDDDADYIVADDLRELATELLGREELHLAHLHGVPIAYLWRRAGGKAKGKAVLGKCQKPSGLLLYFSEQTFVIWLAADHLRSLQFTRRQIEALLYHELLQAGVDEEGKPCLNWFDFDGFRLEVEHYGEWSHDLMQMGDTVRQLPLFEGEER